MTATGIAYLAGLGVNFWKDQEELLQIYYKTNPEIFKPKLGDMSRSKKRQKWKNALDAILSIKKT